MYELQTHISNYFLLLGPHQHVTTYTVKPKNYTTSLQIQFYKAPSNTHSTNNQPLVLLNLHEQSLAANHVKKEMN